MPPATMAECIKAAQNEQRDNTRPWAAVQGPFGAVVATLKRLQRTVVAAVCALWQRRRKPDSQALALLRSA